MSCIVAWQNIVRSLLNAVGNDVQKKRLSGLVLGTEEYAQEFHVGLGKVSQHEQETLEMEYPELFCKKAA